MDMTRCLRCSTCGISWPRTAGFFFCPTCGEQTDAMDRPPEMTEEAARKVRATALFEREYELYDRGEPSKCGEGGRVRREMRKRGASTPEELGAMEAGECR